MKKKLFLVLLSMIGTLMIVGLSCSLESMFAQPSASVSEINLTGDVSADTTLNIKTIITNNDWREASVSNATYTVIVEGVKSQTMTYGVNSAIGANGNITLNLPLTMSTSGAAFLLTKLTETGKLDFSVTGSFGANVSCLGDLTLPLNTTGVVDVVIKTDQFFKQPQVTVEKYIVASNPLLGTNIRLNILATVKNMDSHSATINEVDYVVNLEGVKSPQMGYKDDFKIGAKDSTNDTVNLTLPLTLNKVDEACLLLTSTVNYAITGNFFATTDIGSGDMSFYLPLNVSGTASIVNKGDLNTAINSATDLITGHEGLPQAPALQTEIDNATTVYNNNDATQTQVDTSTTDLNTAASTFSNFL